MKQCMIEGMAGKFRLYNCVVCSCSWLDLPWWPKNIRLQQCSWRYTYRHIQSHKFSSYSKSLLLKDFQIYVSDHSTAGCALFDRQANTPSLSVSL